MTDPDMVEYEYAVCAHCEGAGCMNCSREGRVLVRKPATRCPHCEGVGCIYCGFTGWAHPKGKYD